MKPSIDIHTLPTYAKNVTPIPPEQRPSEEDIAQGVEPLDPLPAQWWNYYWNEITSNYSNVASYAMSLGSEVVNLLQAAGLSPLDTDESQLLKAVKFLCQVIGTDSTAGAVKSSSASGKVSIAPDTGVMTVNNMGDTANLTTELKSSLVTAINELVTKLSALRTELLNTINEKQLRIRIGAPANPQPGDIWLEES